MALIPIVGEVKVRAITTFDLEWVPPEEIAKPAPGVKWDKPRYSEPMPLRVCGVYDERGYRNYPSISEFLECELTKANRNRWFYAHAGGLSDMAFVFDEIIRHVEELGFVSYKVKACFSGSAAIIVRVQKGKSTWCFVDSFWLLHESLAKIGKGLDMVKLEEEKRKTRAEARRYYREAPLTKLVPYNEQDCRILHAAIERFQDTVLRIGGQLQMTIASTGLHLFRRRFLLKRIETSEALNALVEQSYFASRVEVFNTFAKGFKIYDINSSFPYSMTFPCPGDFRGERTTLPEGEDAIYFADVDIEVPDCYLPPVPYRLGQRLFFPVGRWRSWLCKIDIDLLQERGGKILKVHGVLEYEPCTYLKDYAETIYEMRRTTKIEFEKMVYKYLLNSLYGKMAEGLVKSTVLIHPETIDREGMQKLMPGVWQIEKESKVAHRHVPMSAWIVALSRKWIFQYDQMALDQGHPIHYNDTDSVCTPAKLPCDPSKLGMLKEEKRMDWARFAAPKVYQGEGMELQPDGSWKPIFLNKAKGFSLPRDKDEAVKELTEIIEGKEIYIQRMARLRELWSVRGDPTPVEVLVRKALTGKNVTKRRQHADGSTEPWNVKELLERFKKTEKANV